MPCDVSTRCFATRVCPDSELSTLHLSGQPPSFFAHVPRRADFRLHIKERLAQLDIILGQRRNGSPRIKEAGDTPGIGLETALDNSNARAALQFVAGVDDGERNALVHREQSVHHLRPALRQKCRRRQNSMAARKRPLRHLDRGRREGPRCPSDRGSVDARLR